MQEKLPSVNLHTRNKGLYELNFQYSSFREQLFALDDISMRVEELTGEPPRACP
jgi:hypothetical protein